MDNEMQGGNNIIIKKFSIEDIIIVNLILSVLVIFPQLNLSHIGTNIVIPITFIIFIAKGIGNGSLRTTTCYNLLLIFFIWSSLVSLIANDIDAAYYTQRRFFIIILYLYPLVSYTSKSIRNLRLVFVSYVIVLIATIFLFYIGASHLEYQIDSRSDNTFDPNSYSYYIFVGIFSAFILNIYSKKRIFTASLITLLIISSLSVILFTASRGGFIIFSISVISWLGILIYQNARLKASFFFKIGGFLVVVLIFSIYSQNINFTDTYLYHRFTALEERESPRQAHFTSAIGVGIENFVLGVGGGNYALQYRSFEQGSFSHNGFTEAFANYGSPGLLLYVALFLEYLRRIKHMIPRRGNINKIIPIHCLFLFIFALYNFFYVAYLTAEFMGIFIAFRAHLEYHSRNPA